MSGSALSPWAWVEDPQRYTREAADQLGCPRGSRAKYAEFLHCLRDKSVEDILQVNIQQLYFE